MPRKARRSHATDQKVALLRRHFVEKVPISQICEEADIQPSLFYYWQKQLFENADRALEGPKSSSREQELARKVEHLEAKVARKDQVIAEISEEYVQLKKAVGEP